MENTWQIAKSSLLVEEAKKQSDTAHTYSLEIGRIRTKPPPVELQQYLIPPPRPNMYKLLWQRETGDYLTTSGKEMLIHSIETYWNPVQSKPQDVKDEKLFDIFFNCCQLPKHSWKNINRALQIATQNCHSISLPNLRKSEARFNPTLRINRYLNTIKVLI